MSFKQQYQEEVDQLFGKLKPKGAISKDAVVQEGPLTPLVPFGLNGADVIDSTDSMDVLVYIPDIVLKVLKASVVLVFRQFFSSATSASSGGGATSGASSTSTSDGGGSSTPTSGASSASSAGGTSHTHQWASYIADQAPGGTSRLYTDAGATNFWIPTNNPSNLFTGTEVTGGEHTHGIAHTHTVTIGSHTHGIAHTHSTPAHAHGLTYGVFKEAMPASHSVELRVYKWSGTVWTLLDTITGLTDDVEDVDLTGSITGPGKFKIALISAAAQPNGGRLGVDVAGHVVCAIQPR